MTHELQAPLVAIRGASNLIQAENDPAAIDRYASDIDSWIQLIAGLIDNADALARGSVLRLKLEQCYLLRDVFAAAIRQATLIVRDRRFSISGIRYSGFDQFAPLWVDRRRFQQVAFNLLSNAIKYSNMEASSFRVEVAATQNADEFQIRVLDWGIGVDERDSERIFEGGFRTKAAQARQIRGAGLGLTVARRIVEAHSGRLRLTNNRSPTEFTIAVPVPLAKYPRSKANIKTTDE